MSPCTKPRSYALNVPTGLPLRPGTGKRPRPSAFRMRQTASRLRWGKEVGDHKGEVIQRKTCRAAKRADDGPLLVGGLPRQFVRPSGAVLAVLRSALAPLA